MVHHGYAETKKKQFFSTKSTSEKITATHIFIFGYLPSRYIMGSTETGANVLQKGVIIGDLFVFLLPLGNYYVLVLTGVYVGMVIVSHRPW